MDNDERELGDIGDNEDFEDLDNQQEEVIDENDTNTDNRFPEEFERGFLAYFANDENNRLLVKIDEEFIKKKSNLFGIKCEEYLNILLSQSDEYLNVDDRNLRKVYGLIHKRFITTPKGLALMREKYLNGLYGSCPRILCNKQPLIPVGLSESIGYSRVRGYCPICEEVYKPHINCEYIDGSYFGTSFPQKFLMAYPDLNPKLVGFKKYMPKLYGFKLFGKYGSKYYTEDKNELLETMKRLNITLDDD